VATNNLITIEEVVEFLQGHGWTDIAKVVGERGASALDFVIHMLEDSGYPAASHDTRLLARRMAKAA
jgi:hypothetical protein